jgi:2-polyprenyl-3-methyl-5-hydroxy-6-metoxy-1,4-benzoquinol methylase
VVGGHQELATRARERYRLTTLRTSVRGVSLADGAAGVVCLLDVIEHFQDPVDVLLRETTRVLAPDGRLVVSVPAHQWLWSAFDDRVGHVRRYTRAALRADLAAVGFGPLLLTHIVSWLVRRCGSCESCSAAVPSRSATTRIPGPSSMPPGP